MDIVYEYSKLNVNESNNNKDESLQATHNNYASNKDTKRNNKDDQETANNGDEMNFNKIISKNSIQKTNENIKKSINDNGKAQLNKTIPHYKRIMIPNNDGLEIKYSEILKTSKVNKLSKTKNGNIIIDFGDEESIISAENNIKKSNVKCEIKVIEKPLPKMKINYVSTDIKDDNIKTEIFNKNDAISKLIEEGESFEVIFSKDLGNDKTKNVYIKVGHKIYETIKNNGNKLYIGFQVCYVNDHVNITQCYHCQYYGHLANDCKHKNEESSCFYCSGKHPSKECSNKGNKKAYNCINCIRNGFDNHNHTANDRKCPIYGKIMERKRNRLQL